MILHSLLGRFFVGLLSLLMHLGMCWLILSCNLWEVRPTYRQSQRHTYWYTTILCWWEGRTSLWIAGKIFPVVKIMRGYPYCKNNCNPYCKNNSRPPICQRMEMITPTLVKAILKFCTTNKLFKYFRRRYKDDQLKDLNNVVKKLEVKSEHCNSQMCFWKNALRSEFHHDMF